MAEGAVAAGARQTQMNTRIEAGLKEAGDAVLARLGYTPSAAVRGLWRFVVSRRDDAAAIQDVIAPQDADASDDAARRAASTAALRSLYQETARDLGIASAQSAGDLPSWRELRDTWYDEWLDRRA